MFARPQLFKKPHPQKKLSTRYIDSMSLAPMASGMPSAASDRLFFHNLDNLRPTKQPVKGKGDTEVETKGETTVRRVFLSG